MFSIQNLFTSSVPAFPVPGSHVNADLIMLLDDKFDPLDASIANEVTGNIFEVHPLQQQGDEDNRGADGGSDVVAAQYTDQPFQEPSSVEEWARIWLPRCDDSCEMICGMQPPGNID